MHHGLAVSGSYLPRRALTGAEERNWDPNAKGSRIEEVCVTIVGGFFELHHTSNKVASSAAVAFVFQKGSNYERQQAQGEGKSDAHPWLPPCANSSIRSLEYNRAFGFLRSIKREKVMRKKILFVTAILASFVLPTTEAMALRAGNSQDDYRVAYHRGNHRSFHTVYREGYDAGYRRGYSDGGSYRPGLRVSATPAEWLGITLLGATYGYWSDGYHTYGGDPCYRYNDRDWDFERVC
jgi:hypothetical protein